MCIFLSSFLFTWPRAQAPFKDRLPLLHLSLECDGGLPI